MREAKPDDPIFKIGYVIGEKRLRNSQQDLKKLRKAKGEAGSAGVEDFQAGGWVYLDRQGLTST